MPYTETQYGELYPAHARRQSFPDQERMIKNERPSTSVNYHRLRGHDRRLRSTPLRLWAGGQQRHPAARGRGNPADGIPGVLVRPGEAPGYRRPWCAVRGLSSAYAINPGTGHLIWSFIVPVCLSSQPGVANGIVYLGASDGSVYALKASTGKHLWHRAGLAGDFVTTPVPAGRIVYVDAVDSSSSTSVLYALRASNGTVVWTRDTGSGMGCPAAVAGGVVYAGYDNALHALSALTGATIWQAADPGGCTAAVANGLVYVGSGDPADSVYALKASSGAIVWRYPVGKPGGSSVPSAAAVAAGAVYISVVYAGGEKATVYALSGATGRKLWTHVVGDVASAPSAGGGVVYVLSGDGSDAMYALRASTGAEIWHHRMPVGTPGLQGTTDALSSGPALSEGLVYGLFQDKLYALRTTTGAKLWSFTMEFQIDSVLVSHGALYMGSADGKLYALNSTTGSRLWSDTLGGWVQNPAAAGGAVYVGTSNDNDLHAINARTGARLWKHDMGGTVGRPPVVVGSVVYAVGDGVYALRASDGHQIWTTPGESSPAPVVAHDVVYLYAARGDLEAAHASTGAAIWDNAGDFATEPIVVKGVVYVGGGAEADALKASTGDRIWSVDAEPLIPEAGTPAVGNGRVYLATMVGCHVFAVEASTGRRLWRWPSWTDGCGGGPQVPLWVGAGGGVVYDMGEGGALYVLKASTGHELWSFNPPDGLTRWEPAPLEEVNGVVYMHSKTTVYALEASTGHKLWSYTPPNLVGSPCCQGVALYAVVRGITYIGSFDTLSALNAGTGTLLWKFRTGRELD
jgi:outer membrane protein assembly factor BamB